MGVEVFSRGPSEGKSWEVLSPDSSLGPCGLQGIAEFLGGSEHVFTTPAKRHEKNEKKKS